MIAIVDYGVGNLANVARALGRADAKDVRVTRDRDEIAAAAAVVLPGVGHFGHCARELARHGLARAVHETRERGTPLLGLCVGMQLLFETSEEDPDARGLGLLRGTVRRIAGGVRVPHTGWDEVRLRRAHPWLAGVPDGAHFYFVHSYAPAPADDADVVGACDYGAGVVAIVGSGEILGVQFHPEKSGAMGTRLLRAFVRAVERVAA